MFAFTLYHYNCVRINRINKINKYQGFTLSGCKGIGIEKKMCFVIIAHLL